MKRAFLHRSREGEESNCGTVLYIRPGQAGKGP